MTILSIYPFAENKPFPDSRGKISFCGRRAASGIFLLGGLTSGLVGGFTTYSSFNYETLELFQENSWFLGLANLGATVLGCLAAGPLGVFCGRLLVGR